jgi:Uri superfamily endonuclease
MPATRASGAHMLDSTAMLPRSGPTRPPSTPRTSSPETGDRDSLRRPGSYVFALALDRARQLSIGRLGCFRLEPGIYLYVGSARGPGGLAARLGHHWRRAERPHWHIDYLRRAGRPVGAGLRRGRAAVECRWAARLATMPVARAGPAGFGASDCRCVTHLFRLGVALTAGRDEIAELAGLVDPVLSCESWLDGRGHPIRTRP